MRISMGLGRMGRSMAARERGDAVHPAGGQVERPGAGWRSW
jgi:hypothetical protein